jgi:hypothetical protein
MILLIIDEMRWRLSIRKTVCFRPIVDELSSCVVLQASTVTIHFSTFRSYVALINVYYNSFVRECKMQVSDLQSTLLAAVAEEGPKGPPQC